MKKIMYVINALLAAWGSILWGALSFSVIIMGNSASSVSIRLALCSIPILAFLWCNVVALFQEEK